ncbi:MAG TPA: amidophosphoribosyltransferase, partial [Pseudonocardiaceae bacterium]|nr:amidophosphoribosyltransferase [Pseudonocardiaceae bacterium]
TGEYPIPLPDEALIGKHLLEDLDAAARHMDPGAVGAASAAVPSGYGAEDAVRRP